MKKINIGDKFIGEGEPTFIIAEAGRNHGGNFEAAKRMVKVAAEAGADAVTFQHLPADKLTVGAKASTDLLNDSEWESLFRYARELGLLYTVCVIDNESVDWMVEHGATFLKIVSGDLTNLPFLEHCARKKVPIFLSTGAADIEEVTDALNTIKAAGNQDILLYHTNSGYPTPQEQVNLRVMDTLMKTFKLPTGFCDHTVEVLPPIIAVARGAKVIEKHFTLNRSLKGIDYAVSLEPEELKEMIRSIRLVEKMLGSPEKKPLEYEDKTRKLARRSIVSRVRIPRNTTITGDMLTFKRPGTGISPSLLNLVVGKTARVDIKEDEIINWEML